MTERINFEDAATRSGSPAQVVARIGIASLAALGVVHEFARGQDAVVPAVIGRGILTEAARRHCLYGETVQYAVGAEADVAGTVSAVTKTGAGPSVTCAALAANGDEAAGPWFAFPNLRLTVTRGGALGVARMAFSFDGVTTHETVDLQPQTPGSITGTADITLVDFAEWAGKTVDLLDVDGTNPSAITLTAPATLDDVIAQIDAIPGVTATLVGGRYVRLSGSTLGSTGSITNGAGTANALLGLTAGQTADGVDSTYEPSGTGVQFVFPVGTYVEGTTYDTATTAPRMAIAGAIEAANVLRAEGVRFAILHVLHEPVDGTDLLAWQTALEQLRLGWQTAEDNPIFVKWVLGTPLGLEGVPVDVTNWQDNDQDVKTALAGTQEGTKFNTVVHGDVYVDWPSYSGRHRAQLAVPYVEELAWKRLNVNPGLGSKGPLRAAYLKSITGAPARTEAAALVKMQDSGFSVLRNDGSLPYIRAGRTRAPSTSQLTGEHTARAALECGRILREVAFSYANDTPNLGKDGKPSAVDLANIQGRFNTALDEGITRLGYASSARFVVTDYVAVGGTDKLTGKAALQRLGNVVDVEITIAITNSVVVVEGLAA